MAPVSSLDGLRPRRPRYTEQVMNLCCPSEPLTVYEGLAMEETLLDAEASGEWLLVWTGRPAVVIGKNQNPWRECNLRALADRGLPLARRISGGGAVYHDEGNLNLSWILNREGYSPNRVAGVLIRALAALGVEAGPGPGGALTVAGRKVSGAAFCYRKQRVLHHGTLLLRADLPRMRAVLSPPRLRLDTHAIASRPAAVMNLQEKFPQVTAHSFSSALQAAAEEEWGPLSPTPPNLDTSAGVERLRDRQWIWDQTPAFRVRIPGGETLHVRRGCVTSLSLNDREIPVNQPFSPGGIRLLESQLNAPGLLDRIRGEGWEFSGDGL